MSFVFDLPLLVVGPCVVLLLVGFAIGGLALFRSRLLPRLRFGHSDAHFSGAMVASIMVFYGLALALTAVHVWETYEDVASVTSREAATLATLYRNVSEYPEPTRSLLQAGLKEYMDYTIHEAWPLQRRGIVPIRGIRRIDRFEATLMNFEPKTEGQKLLAGEALRVYNTMIEVRRMRLDAVEIRLPPVMWLVVLAGAAISLVSSFFFPVEDFRVHATQVALLCVLIGVVIFMIVAFDRPFRGDLGLTAAPYELVYDQLMRH
jgi:hypothetical protein